MRPSILKTCLAISAVLFIAWAARSQTNSSSLEVSARGSLLLETNTPHLFLTVRLLNTSSNTLTVLTRNLNLGIEPSNGKLVLSLGYDRPAVTYQGHPLIPSFYDFSPVVLRPNEAAIILREIESGLGVLGKTSDTPLVVVYSVSANWGERFGVWSGRSTSPEFTATVRK